MCVIEGEKLTVQVNGIKGNLLVVRHLNWLPDKPCLHRLLITVLFLSYTILKRSLVYDAFPACCV